MLANEACEIVEDVMGVNAIEKNTPPSMASEDFSYMLKEKPGAYIWLGAGNPGEGKMLHNSCYDFNDEILQIDSKNYYFSNVIARSSKTMLECNNSKIDFKKTGTEG